eukprot:CCRYP_020783-RA/>CCRYP_020783-RA protein AED:0.06 eAED:0.23 QI:0/-1/0/1/-1/0/1/0/156
MRTQVIPVSRAGLVLSSLLQTVQSYGNPNCRLRQHCRLWRPRFSLAHCCRELFPIMDMVSLLVTTVGLPVSGATMNVTIHEDNAGALVIPDTLSPQFTPRIKHYVIKMIWFREQIVFSGIRLFKMDTVEQLGDMFTKGLPRTTFEYLRKKLLGWYV